MHARINRTVTQTTPTNAPTVVAPSRCTACFTSKYLCGLSGVADNHKFVINPIVEPANTTRKRHKIRTFFIQSKMLLGYLQGHHYTGEVVVVGHNY